jgi:disulfide bond formation protein DsbB
MEKIFIILLILVFIFSFLISIYHFGIEQGFFQESSVCGLKNATEIMSKEELLKQLNEKTISCKDVKFRIFGLSLTSINIFISLIIIFILTKTYISYEKIKS